jgi:hypothetical protein
MSYPRGSLNLENIKLGIFQWVKYVTQGIIPENQIIWRNQSEPLPPRPCVTMKIINGPTPTDRNAALFFNAPNRLFNQGMQMEMDVSIQIFGNTRTQRPLALQLTLDLNTSLIQQSILDRLKQSGISIQGKSEVRNLTALEETEYEERAGFDVSMGLVQNILDDPGTIETINGTIDTPDGNRLIKVIL